MDRRSGEAAAAVTGAVPVAAPLVWPDLSLATPHPVTILAAVMEDPEEYSRNSGDSLKDARIVLEEYREWFQDGDPERILDVGCGPGDVTVHALQPFFKRARVFGCDESKSMIDYATRKYSYSDVFFELVDLNDAAVWDKWDQESFSKVFSFYALHRIPNKRNVAETVYKLLAPGGQILFITPVENPVYQVFKRLLDLEKYSIIHERLERILDHILEIDDPAQAYASLLSQCSFQDVRCHVIDSSFHYPSLESYLSDQILQVFLLASKSLQRAKQKLDSYYTARTVYPSFFKDLHSAPFDKTTDRPFNVLYFPKLTGNGSRVLFMGCNKDCETMNFDIKDYFCKIFLLADYWYSFGPLSSGAILLVDFTNFSSSLIPKLMASPLKTFIKLVQETNPVRAKKLIMYNAASSLTRFVQLLLSFANPKYSERLSFIEKGRFDDLKRIIPQQVLPQDYGGKEISVAELSDKWEDAIAAATEWRREFYKYKSEESKRPGKPNAFLDEMLLGTEGTFSKLAVD